MAAGICFTVVFLLAYCTGCLIAERRGFRRGRNYQAFYEFKRGVADGFMLGRYPEECYGMPRFREAAKFTDKLEASVAFDSTTTKEQA